LFPCYTVTWERFFSFLISLEIKTPYVYLILLP
jgi:hypothetical protein